mgnify:CR=1 FL=1
MRFFLDYLEHIFGDIKPPTWAVIAFFLGLLLVAAVLFPTQAQYVEIWILLAIWNTAPLWLPFVLAIVFWQVWLAYRRAAFQAEQDYILLEIKLPQDIDKSPLAMELAIVGLHMTSGQSTWYDMYVLGKMRTHYSLEIVSIEGSVHFYIWTRASLRDLVEASLYGQYPNIEIYEVPDYTEKVPYFDYTRMGLYALQYKYSADNTFYPIRTYMDFKMEDNPKEEYKVDPLASVLEYMGSIGPGEQVWLQMIIRPYKAAQSDSHGIFNTFDYYKDGKAQLKKMREELKETSQGVEGEEREYLRIPARGEAERINSVDRKLSKLAFEVAVRGIYLGFTGSFTPSRIAGLVPIFRPFNYPSLNSLGFAGDTTFNFPWQDYNHIRANKKRKKFLEAYRLRAAFLHPNNHIKTQFMSPEELATIFHFPGRVATTPGLERITSRKASPPPDLPR